MPIRPENKSRYPTDWPLLSQVIRFERANGRCECHGECGAPGCGPDRCTAIHGKPAPVSGKTVVLTTAHLNHTPEDCDPDNLRAFCQRCHLAYDRDHHAATRAAARRAASDVGMDSLFDARTECTLPGDTGSRVNEKAPALRPTAGGTTHLGIQAKGG